MDGTGGGERFSFRHLNTDDGLSGDSVFCMLQDSLGYLWLGTFSGLSRYDGSRVIVYRPVPGDPESLPSSLIFDLHEDSTGTLWIASDGGGLARFSRIQAPSNAFPMIRQKPDSLGSDRVFSVTDDSLRMDLGRDRGFRSGSLRHGTRNLQALRGRQMACLRLPSVPCWPTATAACG
jgi:hypothetical protein